MKQEQKREAGADLGLTLTDFLNERRRRKLLGGSEGMYQWEFFFDFNFPKSPSLGLWVIQTGQFGQFLILG